MRDHPPRFGPGHHQIFTEADSGLRIVQIQADDGPWWRLRGNILEVAKRTVPNDLCDMRDHPGCGGPLYRWTQPRTTLDYWPVVRCENHLKLQSLYMQYRQEWSSQHEWWEQAKASPLCFFDWLKEHWGDDTSLAEVGPYWKLAVNC
jgi:hypothetical protein